MSFWNKFDEEFELEDGTSLNLSFFWKPTDGSIDLNDMNISIVPNVPVQEVSITMSYEGFDVENDNESAYARAMEVL